MCHRMAVVSSHNCQCLLLLGQTHCNFDSFFKSQSLLHGHFCPGINQGWYTIKKNCYSPVGMVRVVYPASFNHQEETVGCPFEPLQGSSGHLCQTRLFGVAFHLVVHVGHREETQRPSTAVPGSQIVRCLHVMLILFLSPPAI